VEIRREATPSTGRRWRRPTGAGGPPEILSTHLIEGIGIALDPGGERMFVTDAAGNVYLADLDGSTRREILVAQGNLTGIAYARLPAMEAGERGPVRPA
jgi:hypothetical protein